MQQWIQPAADCLTSPWLQALLHVVLGGLHPPKQPTDLSPGLPKPDWRSVDPPAPGQPKVGPTGNAALPFLDRATADHPTLVQSACTLLWCSVVHP